MIWHRKNQRYIPIHSIAENLRNAKSSFFTGRGKKNAWNTWKQYEELTVLLSSISIFPSKENVDIALPTVERIVVLLYDRTSMCQTVNECRKDLFSRKRRLPEGLPPTLHTLELHLKRAVYQASFC